MDPRNYYELLANEDHLRTLIAHYLVTNELPTSSVERVAGDYDGLPDQLQQIVNRLKSEIA